MPRDHRAPRPIWVALTLAPSALTLRRLTVHRARGRAAGDVLGPARVAHASNGARRSGASHVLAGALSGARHVSLPRVAAHAPARLLAGALDVAARGHSAIDDVAALRAGARDGARDPWRARDRRAASGRSGTRDDACRARARSARRRTRGRARRGTRIGGRAAFDVARIGIAPIGVVRAALVRVVGRRQVRVADARDPTDEADDAGHGEERPDHPSIVPEGSSSAVPHRAAARGARCLPRWTHQDNVLRQHGASCSGPSKRARPP